jgi:hypothetical protein
MALGQRVRSYNHWHNTHQRNTVPTLDRSWDIALLETEIHAIVEGKTLCQPGKKAWPSKVF